MGLYIVSDQTRAGYTHPWIVKGWINQNLAAYSRATEAPLGVTYAADSFKCSKVHF